MKSIDLTTYQEMRAGAAVLEADSFGEKVLHLANDNILKLFRRKRLISSALWSPYAERFAYNAVRLSRLGICAPTIISVFRIPAIERDAVLYKLIQGKTLRQEYRDNPYPENLDNTRAALACFIRKLFDHGIYFRSLHLGNIVRTPSGELGLIDISDLRIFPFALTKSLRKRNSERLIRLCGPGEASWIDTRSILNDQYH